MSRDVPGFPRQRLRSHADDEPIPERVYEVLRSFDERIEDLKDDSLENKRQNADIISKLEDIKATDRHAFTKLIVGLASTALVTIGGVVGGMQAFKPAPPPPPAVRSELDTRLDVCRPMHDPGSRAECFQRVFDGATK